MVSDVTRNDIAEVTLYGSAISYYTGKLEGYLRYKEIPYRLVHETFDVVPCLRRRRRFMGFYVILFAGPPGGWPPR